MLLTNMTSVFNFISKIITCAPPPVLHLSPYNLVLHLSLPSLPITLCYTSHFPHSLLPCAPPLTSHTPYYLVLHLSLPSLPITLCCSTSHFPHSLLPCATPLTSLTPYNLVLHLSLPSLPITLCSTSHFPHPSTLLLSSMVSLPLPPPPPIPFSYYSSLHLIFYCPPFLIGC